MEIYIVDDTPDSLQVMARALEMTGATVVAFGSARSVLTALEKGGRPEVIVTDLSMPDMDGVQLMQAVRALPVPLGRTPMLAISAYVGLQYEGAALLASGFDAMLRKPEDLHRLAGVAVGLARRGPVSDS